MNHTTVWRPCRFGLPLFNYTFEEGAVNCPWPRHSSSVQSDALGRRTSHAWDIRPSPRCTTRTRSPLLLPLAHNILPKLDWQLCPSPRVVAQQGCHHPMEEVSLPPREARGLTTREAKADAPTPSSAAESPGALMFTVVKLSACHTLGKTWQWPRRSPTQQGLRRASLTKCPRPLPSGNATPPRGQVHPVSIPGQTARITPLIMQGTPAPILPASTVKHLAHEWPAATLCAHAHRLSKVAQVVPKDP